MPYYLEKCARQINDTRWLRMRAIRIYFVFFRAYIKKLTEYKADFFMGTLSFFINQVTSIVFITIIFQGISKLGDWSFYEIIMLYGLSLIPKGLDHFFTDNLWAFSSSIVKEGKFDRYLLRPLSPLYHVIIETVQFDAVGEFVVGIIAFCIGINNIDLNLHINKVLLLIVFIIMGSLIYSCIKIICASISFWKGKSGNILKVVYMMSDFNKYPISIYNIILRNILTYLIPFAFTAYYPAMYLLGRYTLFETLIPCIIVTSVISLISFIIWTLGIKSYESAGH